MRIQPRQIGNFPMGLTLNNLGKYKYFVMAFSQFLLALISEMIGIPH